MSTLYVKTDSTNCIVNLYNSTTQFLKCTVFGIKRIILGINCKKDKNMCNFFIKYDLNTENQKTTRAPILDTPCGFAGFFM